jgi:hypothetical protein
MKQHQKEQQRYSRIAKNPLNQDADSTIMLPQTIWKTIIASPLFEELAPRLAVSTKIEKAFSQEMLDYK